MKTKKKNNGFGKYILGVIGGIILIVFTYITIETVTSGAELTVYERKEIALSEENRELKDKIVKDSSLMGMDEKSQELGFIKPSQIIYIGGKEEFAQLPQ